MSIGLDIKYVDYAGNQASVQEFNNFGFHDFFPNADLNIGWAF
jgi:hypothetical protein